MHRENLTVLLTCFTELAALIIWRQNSDRIRRSGGKSGDCMLYGHTTASHGQWTEPLPPAGQKTWVMLRWGVRGVAGGGM
jgi:hypothetical protein